MQFMHHVLPRRRPVLSSTASAPQASAAPSAEALESRLVFNISFPPYPFPFDPRLLLPPITITTSVKPAGAPGPGDDAQSPSGPQLPVGSAVVWTHVVRSPQYYTFSAISVADDTGVPPTLVAKTGDDDLLSLGEEWVYESTGTVMPGQQVNFGRVTGTDPTGTTHTRFDPAYYFGAALPNPVETGMAAGIGFWHNKNGQALVKSFNGGPASTALGDWLANTFPALYGSAAGIGNLAGRTNAQVADFYRDLFGAKSKLEAQVMAAALSVYATAAHLGGSAGAAYGFKVTATGLGGATYNVGRHGAAFGVAADTAVTVLHLLRAANDRTAGGILYGADAALRKDAQAVFSGINESGRM